MRKLLLVVASLAAIGPSSIASAQEARPAPNGDRVATAPAATSYGAETAFTGGGLEARETRLSDNIRNGENTGALSRSEANRDFQNLSRIRLYQLQHSQPNGYISDNARAQVSQRLDHLDVAVSSHSK